MWKHDCKVERTVMYVEDGKECNWCGRREEDETSEFGKLGPNEFPNDEVSDMIEENLIENVEVTDMPDGSAKITMDITPEAQQAFMKQGLTYLIEEMRMNDKVKVLDPNGFSEETKTWELSDDDANALFHFGFISALKLGMGEEK